MHFVYIQSIISEQQHTQQTFSPIQQKKDFRVKFYGKTTRDRLSSFLLSCVCLLVLEYKSFYQIFTSRWRDDVVSRQQDEERRKRKRKSCRNCWLKFKRKLHNIFHSTLHTFSLIVIIVDIIMLCVVQCWTLFSFCIQLLSRSPSTTFFSSIFCSHVQKLFYAFQLCWYILHGCWWVWQDGREAQLFGCVSLSFSLSSRSEVVWVWIDSLCMWDCVNWLRDFYTNWFTAASSCLDKLSNETRQERREEEKQWKSLKVIVVSFITFYFYYTFCHMCHVNRRVIVDLTSLDIYLCIIDIEMKMNFLCFYSDLLFRLEDNAKNSRNKFNCRYNNSEREE